jgi:hypothetical protein
MEKFYIFSMGAYGLLSIHILEESLRLGMENAEASVLIPFVFFPLGFIGIYLKKQWGFWMVWLMSVLVAILPTVSHIIPSSESYFVTIYSFWNGVIGGGSVMLAALLSIFGIAAASVGAKMIYAKADKIGN